MEQSKMQKAICVGWHKTGTSTLGDALIILGYRVLGARLDLAQALLNHNYDEVIDVASKFDALQDVPWAALYKELDEAYPNSKFILTIRDDKEWLNSARKHFKDTYTDMRKWIYGNGVLLGNEKLYINRYNQHNKEVFEYFRDRPDDLIVMNFKEGDGWEKLCSFLGCPIPNKPFPHSNKGKHNYTTSEKVLASLKNIIPIQLRKFRLELLSKLGFSSKKDRFNNKKANNQIIKKRRQNDL